MSVLDNFQWRVETILSPIYANDQVIQPRLRTPTDFRLYLSQVTQVQKSLRLLKSEVINESKQVGMQYSDKISRTQPNPLAGLIIGRKNASHLSAMNRQHTRHTKQSALEPYHRATRVIDEYIQMWDRAKIDLQQQMQRGMLYTCHNCGYQFTGPIGGKAPDACPRCGR